MLIRATCNFDFVFSVCLYRNGLNTIIFKSFLIIVFTSILHLFYRIILKYHPKYVRNIFFSNTIPALLLVPSLHFVKMLPHFHLSYGILVCKYKNITITLQKERENPLNISFCFQTGDKIVVYVSTRGHWDCNIMCAVL